MFSEKFLTRMLDDLTSAEAAYESEKKRFADSFENNPNYTIEWHSQSVTVAQARWEVAMNLIPEFDDGYDLEKLNELLNKFFKREMTRASSLVRISASTNPYANLVEQAQYQAKLELLEKLTWEMENIA